MLENKNVLISGSTSGIGFGVAKAFAKCNCNLVINGLGEAARSLLEEKQPSLQFVTPEQIGETCVFLCSDAAAQMTGITMTLDGGWTAQ